MRTSNDNYNRVFVLNHLCISRLQKRHSKFQCNQNFLISILTNTLSAMTFKPWLLTSPFTKTLAQQFQLPYTQKLSLQLQSWNKKYKIFSHKHINTNTQIEQIPSFFPNTLSASSKRRKQQLHPLNSKLGITQCNINLSLITFLILTWRKHIKESVKALKRIT